MPEQRTQQRADAKSEPHPLPKPWRTEGLPKGQPRKPNRWALTALWILGYLIFFGILTVQDLMKGPQTIPYTEFKAQVAQKNIAQVFARGNSIQGALKKPAPLPGGRQGETYQQFTTERPTFATDDLLSELAASQATVRATPLVQQRGFFTNLLISVAPFLLLVGFYAWMFRRQKDLMGGGLFGGKLRQPVNPETVLRVSTKSKPRSARSSISFAIRTSIGKWARGCRKACCWKAPLGPERPCSRAQPRERRTCRFSAPAPPSLSR